jgi:hypothetical protein
MMMDTPPLRYVIEVPKPVLSNSSKIATAGRTLCTIDDTGLQCWGKIDVHENSKFKPPTTRKSGRKFATFLLSCSDKSAKSVQISTLLTKSLRVICPLFAQFCIRGKYSVETRQVHSWFGYSCTKAGNDVHGCTNAAGAWMRRSGKV